MRFIVGKLITFDLDWCRCLSLLEPSKLLGLRMSMAMSNATSGFFTQDNFHVPLSFTFYPGSEKALVLVPLVSFYCEIWCNILQYSFQNLGLFLNVTRAAMILGNWGQSNLAL